MKSFYAAVASAFLVGMAVLAFLPNGAEAVEFRTLESAFDGVAPYIPTYEQKKAWPATKLKVAEKLQAVADGEARAAYIQSTKGDFLCFTHMRGTSKWNVQRISLPLAQQQQQYADSVVLFTPEEVQASSLHPILTKEALETKMRMVISLRDLQKYAQAKDYASLHSLNIPGLEADEEALAIYDEDDVDGYEAPRRPTSMDLASELALLRDSNMADSAEIRLEIARLQLQEQLLEQHREPQAGPGEQSEWSLGVLQAHPEYQLARKENSPSPPRVQPIFANSAPTTRRPSPRRRS